MTKDSSGTAATRGRGNCAIGRLNAVNARAWVHVALRT